MKEQSWLEEGWIYHNHAWHLLHEILKLIPKTTRTLLDYGAGTGLAASVIRSVFPAINPIVCDIEKNSVEFWRKRNLRWFLVDENFSKTPFEDNFFDVVISSHVIEHMEDQSSVIKELFRVCKERIIIVVPDGNVNFYDHKIIFDRKILEDKTYEALSDEIFSYNSFPVYHPHINNLVAIIDKV